MYILNYAQCLAAAALITIIALTVAALVSPRVRTYARRHPWHYAALAVLITVSAVRASKPPVVPDPPPPTGFYLNMLIRPETHETNTVLRPLNFQIQPK